MSITAERFEAATGHAPQQDDLARCNCDQAGKSGHVQCGWCTSCDKPKFMCLGFCLSNLKPKETK